MAELERKIWQALTDDGSDLAGVTRLVESWGDFVNIRDDLWSDPDTGRLRRPAGGVGVGITRRYDRADGRFLPVYENELDLRAIRAMAWTAVEVAPPARALRNALTSYTIGQGFDWSIAPRDGASQLLADYVTQLVDTVLDESDWPQIERESFEREVVDGEFIGVLESDSGGIRLCVREPDELTEPPNKQELDEWLGTDDDVMSWSFGVHSPLHKPDRPLGYHLVRDDYGADWDYYTRGEVLHWKRGGSRLAKRGYSDYYPVHHYVFRSNKIWENTAEGAAIQAAIAYIVEHPQGTTRDQVEQQVLARLNRIVESQGPGSGTSLQRRSIEPGTRIDLPNGGKYHAGLLGQTNSEIYIQVMTAGLRLAAAVYAMPEGMITGDSQSSTFAGALVAEAPFMQGRVADQEVRKRRMTQMIWQIIELLHKKKAFARVGNLSVEELHMSLEVTVQPSEVEHRDRSVLLDSLGKEMELGLISRRTASQDAGRDFEEEQELIRSEQSQGQDLAAMQPPGGDDGGEGEEIGRSLPTEPSPPGSAAARSGEIPSGLAEASVSQAAKSCTGKLQSCDCGCGSGLKAAMLSESAPFDIRLAAKTLKDACGLKSEVLLKITEGRRVSKSELQSILIGLQERLWESRQGVDLTPPKVVRDEAKRGLEWRRKHGRGGTAVGVARARDLSQGKRMSPQTIRRMVSYFARHEVDKKAAGFSSGDDYPSAGRIAWALWGGDAGKAWASKMARRLDKAESPDSLSDSAGAVTTSAQANLGADQVTGRRRKAEGDRCWDGYEPTPGEKPYSKGSCQKVSESVCGDGYLAEAFCPTGPGGGIDNSCPPTRSGRAYAATQIPDDLEGEVELVDAASGEVLSQMSAAEARAAIAETIADGLSVDDLLVRVSTEETRAAAARLRAEFVAAMDARADRARRQEELATPLGLKPGHDSYREPPPLLYHATYAAEKIADEGFRSGQELGQEVLGGTSTSMVSFTTREKAEEYRQGLEVAALAAQGKLDRKQQIAAAERFGMPAGEAIELQQRMEGRGDAGFSFWQAVGLRTGGRFPVFMGSGWPQTVRQAEKAQLVSVPSSELGELLYSPGETEWRSASYTTAKARIAESRTYGGKTGIWRTTDEGNKIFIELGGAVYAGGPNGPVIGEDDGRWDPPGPKKRGDRLFIAGRSTTVMAYDDKIKSRPGYPRKAAVLTTKDGEELLLQQWKDGRWTLYDGNRQKIDEGDAKSWPMGDGVPTVRAASSKKVAAQAAAIGAHAEKVSLRGIEGETATMLQESIESLYKAQPGLPKLTEVNGLSHLRDSNGGRIKGYGVGQNAQWALELNAKTLGKDGATTRMLAEAEAAYKQLRDVANNPTKRALYENHSARTRQALKGMDELLQYPTDTSGQVFGVKAIIEHELGHFVDQTLLKLDPNRRRSLLSDYQDKAKSVSFRARYNEDEYIAESYAFHRMGRVVDEGFSTWFRELGL